MLHFSTTCDWVFLGMWWLYQQALAHCSNIVDLAGGVREDLKGWHTGDRQVNWMVEHRGGAMTHMTQGKCATTDTNSGAGTYGTITVDGDKEAEGDREETH
jgi:hypothetical protein